MIFNLLKSFLFVNICAASSSSTTDTGIEPNKKVFIQIPANVPDPQFNFTTIIEKIKSQEKFKNASNKALAFSTIYSKDFKDPLSNLCDANIDILVSEYWLIDEIKKEFNINNSLANLAQDICYIEIEEWVLKKEILDSKQVDLFNLFKFKINELWLQVLKTAAMRWIDSPTYKNCNKKIKECYNVDDYEKMNNVVKKWLLMEQMTHGSNNSIPPELIRSDWKLLLDQWKISKDSFKITPIGENMNLYHLMNVEGKDFETSVKNLREEIDRLDEDEDLDMKLCAEEIKVFRLRQKMLAVVLVEPLTLESVNLKVKVFERLAEAVVRSEQLSVPQNQEMSALVIKLWLLSRQMFVENAWNEARFGFVSKPQFIRPVLKKEARVKDSEIKPLLQPINKK